MDALRGVSVVDEGLLPCRDGMERKSEDLLTRETIFNDTVVYLDRKSIPPSISDRPISDKADTSHNRPRPELYPPPVGREEEGYK